MRLGVKHMLLQRDKLALRKQQIEVLERLGHPETLHVIAAHGRDRVCVGEGGEADDVALVVVFVVRARRLATGLVVGRVEKRIMLDYGGVFDERFEHLPAPLAVCFVAGDPVHVEQGLGRLWSLQVVAVLSVDVDICFPAAFVGRV